MPTYDYVCGACGHRVEVVHRIHEHGPVECPNCHARAMRKAIGAPTVLYKGSGWAKKDRGAATRTKAAAKAGSSDGGTSDGGTAAGSSSGTSSGTDSTASPAKPSSDSASSSGSSATGSSGSSSGGED
jgi:putative FmdB family regulatory protein